MAQAIPNFRTETRDIGDLKVTIVEYPAMRNLSLVGRLMRICGPALIAAAGDLRADIKTLAPAADILFRNLPPEELQWWARELLEQAWCVVSGKRVELKSEQAINLVFTGRMGLIFEAMAFSLEVNCSDFFSWLLGKVQKIQQQAALARAAQDSSTSTSNSDTRNSKISSLSGASG